VTDSNREGDDKCNGQPATQQPIAAKTGLTRRGALQAIGGGTLGAALGVGLPGVAAAQGAAAAKPAAGSASGRKPYESVRVIELSQTLAGRLTGLLLADQGAQVFVERDKPSAEFDDAYFDRGKMLLPARALADTASADVIIVDGDVPVKRLAHQIVVRVVAALPGDPDYGYLPANCSEDLISGLVGFFTNMSVTGAMLGRPVIYSPLPLASVYTGVNGAVAVAAVLVDRERTAWAARCTPRASPAGCRRSARWRSPRAACRRTWRRS